MINVSKGFARNLLNDNRNYKYFIDITLSDGEILNITNSDLWQRTFRIEDSVSQDNNLDVGDAIINKLSFSLNNIDESYSKYDFTDAELVAYIALDVDGELEKLKKFTGVIDEAIYNGSLISITAFDNMSKADKDFDTSGIKFPVSIGELVLYCATKMGIPLETIKFPNMDFVIQSLPNDSTSTITYRQVISWCAQICGCFARCDRNGGLEIKWYNTECLIEQFADGGTFDTTTTPYSDGDNVDGGTFNTTTTPYSDGASIDAGVFTSVESPHFFTGYSSHNIGVDDVVVTGVSVKTKERDSESASSGSSGYIIAIENNPFVTENNKQAIADFLGKRLIGIKFRTLTASVLSDPSVEAGDVGFFYGLNHNYYPVLVSSVTFSAGEYMKIRSSAKTPARNKAVTYSEETKNYVDLRKKIAIEKSMREIQEQKLNEALNSSSGLYTTIEKGSTGNIYYFHNHKDLSDSDIVWKMTADAWGVSTDGGKTFNGGMTVDGDTITRILTATGINADWIIAGKIKDKNSTNYWNLDTGEFKLSTNTKIGDSTVSSKSYTDDQLKKYYTSTQIDVKVNSIESEVSAKVGNNELATKIQQNAESVRIAWNNISKYIQFESGELRIYDSAVSSSQKLVSKFNYDGCHFYRNDYYVGKIGTNELQIDSSKKGLNFDLESNAAYMTWASEDSPSSSSYTMKWTYVQKNKGWGNYTSGELHAGCNIDMHRWTLKNPSFEGGGVDGTLNFVQVLKMNSDGTIASWAGGCKMQFKNGILISGTWNG